MGQGWPGGGQGAKGEGPGGKAPSGDEAGSSANPE